MVIPVLIVAIGLACSPPPPTPEEQKDWACDQLVEDPGKNAICKQGGYDSCLSLPIAEQRACFESESQEPISNEDWETYFQWATDNEASDG